MNKNVEVIAPTKCLNKLNDNKQIRTCAYCRDSTDNEDQKTSYDSQKIHINSIFFFNSSSNSNSCLTILSI